MIGEAGWPATAGPQNDTHDASIVKIGPRIKQSFGSVCSLNTLDCKAACTIKLCHVVTEK